MPFGVASVKNDVILLLWGGCSLDEKKFVVAAA
jgi:hypothetical protein